MLFTVVAEWILIGDCAECEPFITCSCLRHCTMAPLDYDWQTCLQVSCSLWQMLMVVCFGDFAASSFARRDFHLPGKKPSILGVGVPSKRP